MTGEKILNYRIENLTEENQLYRSFLATHTQFAKKVIIKTFKNPTSFLEKTAFEEEIKKLSLIQHPNIVTLYDQLETDQNSYLIFEHVEGRSLGDHIRKFSGPIPEQKTIKLFSLILDAFAVAHQKGISGGAINPSNIIINPAEQIKVLDLALSKLFNDKNIKLKEIETYQFANPEALSGKIPDVRSDIYSLGVLLFYMLTARHSYENLDVDSIAQKVLEENLPPAKTFYPVISSEIQTIIDKATAKDPQERFQSVKEFKQALIAILPQEKTESHTNRAIENTEEVKETENEVEGTGSFINAPLFVFILLAGIAVTMLIYYSSPREQIHSSILKNVKNPEKVSRFQDSIATAQAEKAIEDSIRIFGSMEKKVVMQVHFHKVKKGETLAKIAKLYRVPLDSLTSLNNISPNEKLKHRQGIQVWVKTIYKVKRNETLATIGKQFGVNPYVLKEVNGLYPEPVEPGEEPKPLIYEGKNIIIPLMLTK